MNIWSVEHHVPGHNTVLAGVGFCTRDGTFSDYALIT